MKTSVISADFRAQYLENPDDPMAFEGPVAVFDGPEDYHHRIDNETDIDAGTILLMRGAGPKGYPGAAEVVNMLPPSKLVKRGIELPCVGDGRQRYVAVLRRVFRDREADSCINHSGTSGTPSILNASPEAATPGSMLALLKNGDRVRIDLLKRTADVQLSAEEIAKRREEVAKQGGYKMRPSQTPWQEIFRNNVSELSEGMVMKDAVKFQRVAQVHGIPRNNH